MSAPVSLASARERIRLEAADELRAGVIAMIDATINGLDWAELTSGQSTEQARVMLTAVRDSIATMPLVDLIRFADVVGVK